MAEYVHEEGKSLKLYPKKADKNEGWWKTRTKDISLYKVHAFYKY